VLSSWRYAHGPGVWAFECHIRGGLLMSARVLLARSVDVSADIRLLPRTASEARMRRSVSFACRRSDSSTECPHSAVDW